MLKRAVTAFAAIFALSAAGSSAWSQAKDNPVVERVIFAAIKDPETRLQGIAVWEILFFVLNALLFALIGLQLPVILDELSGRSTGELIGYAALVTVAVIAARFLWVIPGTYITAWFRRGRRPIQNPGRASILLGWSGMRGAVSLAAALAIPLSTDAGEPFPNRALVIFLTFGVILGTLVAPAFYGISAFVGAGLLVAGTTGFCGMARLLALMPWNRRTHATAT